MRYFVPVVFIAMLSMQIQASEINIPMCCPTQNNTCQTINHASQERAAEAMLGQGCFVGECPPNLLWCEALPSSSFQGLLALGIVATGITGIALGIGSIPYLTDMLLYGSSTRSYFELH